MAETTTPAGRPAEQLFLIPIDGGDDDGEIKEISAVAKTDSDDGGRPDADGRREQAGVGNRKLCRR